MTADAPDTPTDAEQVAMAALDRMGASPAWRDADARAIVRDLRTAGLLRVPAEDEGSLRSLASGTPAGYIVVRHHDGEPDEDVVYHSAAAARLCLDDTVEDEDWRVYEIREVPDGPR